MRPKSLSLLAQKGISRNFENYITTLFLDILSIRGFLNFSVVNKGNRAVILENKSIWNSLYNIWMQCISPTEEPKSLAAPYHAFKSFYNLFYFATPSERGIVDAFRVNNANKLNTILESAAFPELVYYLFTLSVHFGNAQLLQKICDHNSGDKALDLDGFAKKGLLFFIKHAKNKDAVQNIVWKKIQNLISGGQDSSQDKHRLHFAARLNQTDTLNEILKKRPELATQAYEFGITPTMLRNQESGASDAEKNKLGAELIDAAQTGSPDSVALLLQHNADPNFQDKQGLTPLMHTLYNLHMTLTSHAFTQITRLLLKRGAKLNITDGNGKTALMYSASGAPHHYFNTHFLLEHGADPEITDNEGKTALDYANKGGNTFDATLLAIALFLKSEESSTLKQAQKYYPLYFKVFIQELLSEHCPWPWVTNDMLQQLRDDPTAQSLLEEIGDEPISYKLTPKLTPQR